MTILSVLCRTVIDAVFPLAPAERELFSMTPQQALSALPRLPDGPLSGLADAMPREEMDAVFSYKDERVRKLVWNIKYKRSAQAVAIAGYALHARLGYADSNRKIGDRKIPTIIIPIPITTRRRKERGYNQCELIVDELARLSHADLAADHPSEEVPLIIRKEILIRTQHSARQTLKDRSGRVEGAKGIFSADKDAIGRLKIEELKDHTLKDAPIIVVDDVITTGSTMKAALDTLRSAGFTDVHGLALAH